MPEARLQRTRDAYDPTRPLTPFERICLDLTRFDGYARRPFREDTVRVPLPRRWRAPHENAAQQLARTAAWNVIEGDPH